VLLLAIGTVVAPVRARMTSPANGSWFDLGN
jgi:hypothetical protein